MQSRDSQIAFDFEDVTLVPLRKEDGMRGSQNVQVDEVVDFKTDERLSRGTRAFLRALNSPAPPELEKLPALEAAKARPTVGSSTRPAWRWRPYATTARSTISAC
jgi:hypothetical protein